MFDGTVTNFNQKTNSGEVVTENQFSPQGGSCVINRCSSSLDFMHRGYFPIWRKITDWGWYKDANTMRVFLHLLLTANFKEGFYLGHKIEKGQAVTGRKSLSISLGITERSVRTSIERLKTTSEITVKNCNKFSIITLNNYEKYTITTSEPASKRPASDQQVTTSNNVISKERYTYRAQSPKGVPPLETSPVTNIKKYFAEKYLSTTGNEYIPSHAKDGALIKGLLKTISEDELKGLISKFFDLTDEFIINSGRTIGVFKSQINKLRQIQEKTDPLKGYSHLAQE